MLTFERIFAKSLLAGLLFIGLLSLLTSRTYGATQTANDPTHQYPSLVVKFKEGRSHLTPEMKKEVSDFISKTRSVHSNGSINEVYVAAYADLLRRGDEELPANQQDIARLRARNLRDYLEETLKVDVDTYNMAKQANFLSRAFDTENARIKGDATPGRDRVASLIQENGGSSIAVLVVDTGK